MAGLNSATEYGNLGRFQVEHFPAAVSGEGLPKIAQVILLEISANDAGQRLGDHQADHSVLVPPQEPCS